MSMVKFIDITRTNFDNLSTKSDKALFFVKENNNTYSLYKGNTLVSNNIEVPIHSHTWSEITGKPTTFTPSSHSHTWSSITGKPTTFTPSSHTHSVATTSSAGFLSSADKTKLNSIATGAQVNRPIATTAQAQAGTDNTTVMTPLRVKEAIASNPSGYELTKLMIDTALTGSGSDSTQLGKGTSSSGVRSTALASGAYSTGDYSLALGYVAYASGTSSLALGRSASAGGTSSTAIGHGAQTGTSSNRLQLGSSYTLSELRSRVQLTITSDIRDKTDIEEIPKALDFIKDLTPITYVSNERENYISEEQKETDTYKDYLMVEDYDRVSHSQGTKKGSRRRVGLSAQEVRGKLIEHYGSDNYANVVNDNFVEFEERKLDIPQGLENKLTMSYETLVPFLIKAIQEQQELIEELKKKIEL